MEGLRPKRKGLRTTFTLCVRRETEELRGAGCEGGCPTRRRGPKIRVTVVGDHPFGSGWMGVGWDLKDREVPVVRSSVTGTLPPVSCSSGYREEESFGQGKDGGG